MARRPRVPSYRLHKPSGQAVVTIAGRDHYLGPYDSAESREQYARLIGQHLAGGGMAKPPRGTGYTVAEIAAAYIEHARTYYVKDGKPTSQVERVERSLRHATDLFSSTPANEFGPVKLKAARNSMIEAGWTRRHINSCVGCIKGAFKWAVAEELIPSSVYESLRAVAGLREGRSAARESSAIGPAPAGAIAPVMAIVLPVVADMIRLQLLTAMRPGELVLMRPCDIDKSRNVWVYCPKLHKTQHRGKKRFVFLGPQAQAVLAPYLERDPAAFCFSPREGMAASVLRRRKREMPPPSFTGRRAPGLRYTSTSYSQAVRKACIRAGVEQWFPHQLRHSAGTLIRAEFGPDVARAVLGHSSLEATAIYAELDLAKAMEAMGKVG